MKARFKSLILCPLLYALCSTAICWATTYYVDATNGNDSNPGTSEAAPWKTIAKVNNSNFQPGDFILFKRGEIWREQLNVPSSGAEGRPITFGAYGSGDKPIISGRSAVTSWTEYGANVWQSILKKEPKLVSINNTLLEKGLSKNYLESKQWFWEDDVLYLRFRDENSDFIGKVMESWLHDYCIYGTSKNYIKVENITIEHCNIAGIYVNNVKNWVVNNNTVRKIGVESLTESGIRLFNSEYIIISNNIILDIYGDGILGYQSNYFEISDNDIGTCYGPASDNIHLDECNHYKILRNTLSMYGTDSPKGNIHAENGSFGIYRYNECRYGSFGIDLNDSHSIVECNYTHDHKTASWSAGLYMGPFNVDDIIWRYNISYNDENGIAVYGNENLKTNMKYYNNLVYGAIQDGVRFFSEISGEFKNNIIWCPNAIGYLYWVSKLITVNTWISDYNDLGPEKTNFIHWYNGKNYSSFSFYQLNTLQDINSISLDPKIIDPENQNFHIQSISPCIDAGVDIGLTQDFKGTPVPQGNGVDIGAFEYKEDTTPPNKPKGLRIL